MSSSALRSWPARELTAFSKVARRNSTSSPSFGVPLSHLAGAGQQRLPGGQEVAQEEEDQEHQGAVEAEHEDREHPQGAELPRQHARRQVHPHVAPAQRASQRGEAGHGVGRGFVRPEPRRPLDRRQAAGRLQQVRGGQLPYELQHFAAGVDQGDAARRGSRLAQVQGTRRRAAPPQRRQVLGYAPGQQGGLLPAFPGQQPPGRSR